MYILLVNLLITSLAFQHCSIADFLNSQVEVHHGIFLQDVSQPVFYDRILPLWFKFKVPFWEDSDIILSQFPRCFSPEWTKGSACPTAFYLTEVRRRFNLYITSYSQPNIAKRRFQPTFPQKIPLASICLSNRDTRSYTEREDFQNLTQKCSVVPDKTFEKHINDFDYNIVEVYKNMSSSFWKTFWLGMVSGSGKVNAALWANALNSITALMYLNFNQEISRWNMAMQDCANGRLPDLLHKNDLEDALHDALAELENDSSFVYETAYKRNCGSSCYEEGLNSCNFAGDSFVVGVMIPLRSKVSRNLHLAKTTYAEFASNSSICGYNFASHNPEMVMVDDTEGLAYKTDCHPEQLCFLRNALHSDNISPCVSATLSGNNITLQEFWEICPLKCIPQSPFENNAVSIKQISGSELLITGTTEARVSEVIIRCPNQTDHFIRCNRFGAILVKLPCNCKAYSNNLAGIEPFEAPPCPVNCTNTEFMIHHETLLIPAQWVRNESLITLKEVMQLTINYSNVEEIFEDNNKIMRTIATEQTPTGSSNELKTTDSFDNFTTFAFLGLLTLLFCIFLLITLILLFEVRNLYIRVKKMQEDRCEFQMGILSSQFVTDKSNGDRLEQLPNQDNIYEDAEYLSPP